MSEYEDLISKCKIVKVEDLIKDWENKQELNFFWESFLSSPITFQPTLLSQEIVAVQPMPEPQGTLFYLDYRYDNATEEYREELY